MPDAAHPPELNYFYSRLGEDPLSPGDEDALRNLNARNSLIDGCRERGDENMLFRSEYRQNKSFAAAGLSEADYIASRRIDVGLDDLIPGSAAKQVESQPKKPVAQATVEESSVSLDGPAPQPGSAPSDADPEDPFETGLKAASTDRMPARPGALPLSPFEMMMGGRLPFGTTRQFVIG